MSMMSVPVRPRGSVVSPYSARPTVLKQLVQPLYSCYDFATGTVGATNILFSYGIGGTVAGNTTIATELHTNLTAARQLSAPKVFTVFGLRIVPIEIENDLEDVLDDSGAATNAAQTFTGQDSNLLEDLQELFYGSLTRFHIGNVDMFSAPSWFCPANVGLDGVAAAIAGTGASATNVSWSQRFLTFHSVGRYMDFSRTPHTIPPTQDFYVSLEFPQATRPTINADRRLVYAVLDGVLSREVQG